MSEVTVSGQAPSINNPVPAPQGGFPNQAPQEPSGGYQGGFSGGVPQYQQPQQYAVQQSIPQQQPEGLGLGQAPTQQSVQAPAPAQEQPVPQYSGNDPLEVSIDIFTKSSGISQDQFYTALAGALQYGDPQLINLGDLTKGLNKEQAAQAEALAKAAYQQAQNIKQQTIQTAYSKAGGEEQWRAAVGAFNSKAPPAYQAAAKAMEAAGQINEAVEFILDTAKQFGFVNSVQGQSLQGNFGGSAVKGISKAEYSAGLQELAKEMGGFHNLESSPKFKQLTDARNLGVQQGI